MKFLYLKQLLVFVFCLGLLSCEKDEDMVVIQPGTKSLLSATQSALVLTDQDANKDAITFSWTAPDFGYSAAVNYSLEFGVKGTDFANAVVKDYGTSLVKTLKVSELNAIANELKMTGFQKGDMEVRVKAGVGGNYAPTYSDVTALQITPYLSEPPYATLYLVGAATEGAWNENAATPMFRSATDPFVFTYTGYLKADDFKLLGQLGQWAPSWGSGETANGVTKLVFRSSTSEADVNNFKSLIKEAGYHTVTVNLRDMTITVEPYDATGKPTFNSIGLVGEFNGWAAPDVKLTKTTVNPHIWSGSITLAKASELKFRVNEAWDTNWGSSTDVTKLYGKGGAGASNIKMAAGTYKVFFNDLTENYLFIKQ
ncbi:SusE domain-containing protein [Rufibacter sediminis]|uniref:SusE domain-containing protein n=1 Tax=Rufibacter sediminis TaxID=2762756 RepID=A0ABR6VYK3_9BACT|nr:SusE domain-containing protein [Rufibacter sediminis]MBC3542284.1 SusE domain-containing protein [Rufibacter sediminis]